MSLNAITVVDFLPIQAVLAYGHENFEETVLDAFEPAARSQLERDLKPHFKAIHLIFDLEQNCSFETFKELFSRIGYLFKSRTESALYIADQEEQIAYFLKTTSLTINDESYGRHLCQFLTTPEITIPYQVDFHHGKVLLSLDSFQYTLFNSLSPFWEITLHFEQIDEQQLKSWLTVFNENHSQAQQVKKLYLKKPLRILLQVLHGLKQLHLAEYDFSSEPIPAGLISETLTHINLKKCIFSEEEQALNPLCHFKYIGLSKTNVHLQQVKFLLSQLTQSRVEVHLQGCPQLTRRDLGVLQASYPKVTLFSDPM